MSRRPGEGRYAHLEREQRWLLQELPLSVKDERIIVDHYWTGTSLRLRMIHGDGDAVYKLCQKVRPIIDSPASVKITNIYLEKSEFCALSVIPAAIVSKSRWTYLFEGRPYAVDEFKGRHSGLVLAEIELGVDEAPLQGPEFAVAEVTNDDEYSGGRLASASDEDLVRVIERSQGVGGRRGSR